MSKLKSTINQSIIAIICIMILGCTSGEKNTTTPGRLSAYEEKLRDYDSLKQSTVMVLGIPHFDGTIFAQQQALQELVEMLSSFEPTKVVVEWEPKRSAMVNESYRKYLKDESIINKQVNEVYQLGFRLAKKVGNDSIYCFDDQTEFIGSLENFTFDRFRRYAMANDSGFYDRYEHLIIDNYNQNEKIFKELNLRDEIILRNSPTAQKINQQRMHAYEVRAGIQKNWIGPDWLGRWYQRNVRMMANVMKINEPGDRILIIVGDNHKWTLDALFEYNPEFEVVSSWEFLNALAK